MLLLEKCLHSADFIDLCLTGFGLFIKVMTFLCSNSLRVKFMSVFIRVRLKSALWVLLLLLLLSHLLLLQVLPQIVYKKEVFMSKTLVRDLNIN